VRAKTRRQTIKPDGTPGLLCLSIPGRFDVRALKEVFSKFGISVQLNWNGAVSSP